MILDEEARDGLRELLEMNGNPREWAEAPNNWEELRELVGREVSQYYGEGEGKERLDGMARGMAKAIWKKLEEERKSAEVRWYMAHGDKDLSSMCLALVTALYYEKVREFLPGSRKEVELFEWGLRNWVLSLEINLKFGYCEPEVMEVKRRDGVMMRIRFGEEGESDDLG